MLALALAALVTLGPGAVSAEESGPEEAVTAVIARFREEIPRLMEEQGIPGLAVALVDGDQVL